MDAFKQLLIIQFTPHRTITYPPKMYVLSKAFLQSSLLLNGWCSIQIRPTNSSDNLCLLFCIYSSFILFPFSNHLANNQIFNFLLTCVCEMAIRKHSPTYSYNCSRILYVKLQYGTDKNSIVFTQLKLSTLLRYYWRK